MEDLSSQVVKVAGSDWCEDFCESVPEPNLASQIDRSECN